MPEVPLLRNIPKGITATLDDEVRFAPGLAARTNAQRLDDFFTQAAEARTGFNGADGMYTHTIADPLGLAAPRTLFAFGDTYVGGRIGPFRLPPNRMNFIRNTLGIVEGDEFTLILRDPQDRLLRNHREWLVPAQTGVEPEWYWPADMTQNRAGVQLLLGRYEHTGKDVRWDWGVQGTDIATFDPTTMRLRSLRPIIHDDSAIWGAAILERPGTPHTYVYGASKEAPGVTPRLVVARADADDLRRGWQFLDADGQWSPHPSEAARLDVPVASQFSAISDGRDGVHLIVQNGFWPVLRATPGATPHGPFHADQTEVFSLPHVEHPRYVANALIHPQFSDRERLVVSTNQNRFDGVGLQPEDYRPYFMTMPRPGTATSSDERVLRIGE